MKKAGVSSILFVVILLAVGVIADAQQPKKVYRIGYLSSADAASDSARTEGIRVALRERGYIEGQNIVTEYRYAEGYERLPGLAADLVRLEVDIIVTGGPTVIRAAMDATKTTPIVMTGGGTDPVEEGLIKSLARPGGNVTGITNRRVALNVARASLHQRRSRRIVCGMSGKGKPIYHSKWDVL